MNKENISAILILIATAAVMTIFIWWVDRDTDTVEEAQQETLEQIKARIETGAYQARVAESKRLQLEQERQRLEPKVAEMKRNGAIYSVDVEFNEVRIDPVVWSCLDVNQKQGVVMFFSHYFEVSGSSSRCTILSSRNDTKLAVHSIWSGAKIYQ